MTEILRWVVVLEACGVFFGSLFLHGAYRRPTPLEKRLVTWAVHACVFGYALAIGTNVIVNAPVTPGLFIALAVLTPASALTGWALWLGWRKSIKPAR